jgi:hypothetical protein
VAPLPLQSVPESGGPLAFLGTFVLTALFFGLTAHIAARYVLGDVPVRRALVVGVVPAVAVTALIRFPPVVIIPAALLGDFLALRAVYRLRYRTTALVAIVHYTVSVLLAVVVGNTLRILSTAPG